MATIATMKRLGFFGILKVTTQIIHRNFKHFLCIALTLVLPYAFLVAFTPPPNKEAIAASISRIYNYATTGQLPPPHDVNDAMQPHPNPTIFLIIVFIFAHFIDLVFIPPLTFSICRGYLNRSLNLKGSLMAIPRSIRNIILTEVCLFATFMGVIIAVIILIVFCALILSAVKLNPAIPVIILSLGLTVGVIYLIIVCTLAKPVTILEERWGWEAMRRSMYLLDGSKWLAFWLRIFFSICLMFLPISVSKDASMLCKFSVAAVSVTLKAFISVYSMATQVVLYLSCKSYHNESVETLIAASAQFGGEEPAKYMDLESATLNVHV